jgi:hypothetical protein
VIYLDSCSIVKLVVREDETDALLPGSRHDTRSRYLRLCWPRWRFRVHCAALRLGSSVWFLRF